MVYRTTEQRDHTEERRVLLVRETVGQVHSHFAEEEVRLDCHRLIFGLARN